MDLSELSNILTKSQLDKETKLMVVDLVALCKDKELLDDILNLIESWQKSDAQIQEEFIQQLLDLKIAHQNHIEVAVKDLVKDETQEIDGLKVQSEIDRIKKHIMENL